MNVFWVDPDGAGLYYRPYIQNIMFQFLATCIKLVAATMYKHDVNMAEAENSLNYKELCKLLLDIDVLLQKADEENLHSVAIFLSHARDEIVNNLSQ